MNSRGIVGEVVEIFNINMNSCIIAFKAVLLVS